MDAGRLAYFAQEIQLTLWQHRRLHTIAIVMMSIAVTTLMLFLLALFNTHIVLQELGAQAKVLVFLKETIQPDQRRTLKTALETVAGPQAVRFISKAQAWQDFTAWFPQKAQLLEGLHINPLPASYVIKLPAAEGADTSLRNLQQRLTRLPGIEEVEYGATWRHGFRTVLKGIQWVGLVGGIALGIGIIFIIANTTRLTLYTRLDDIEIMQLVGATDRLISIPFLLVGMIQGLAAVLISLALLVGLYYTGLSTLGVLLIDMMGPLPLRFLPWPMIGGTIVAGIGLGALGSALALNWMLRVLRMTA